MNKRITESDIPPDDPATESLNDPRTDEPADDLIGQFVGGYRLAARIGRGGMGAVYLGFHPTLRKRVAIKVLLPALAASEAVQARFFEEARAASEIDDPRIVDVIDLARLPDGRCYIMMEHLRGESLEQMLRRRGTLEPGEAISIAEQVLIGLAAAHDRGIVHRDLKPANLFIVAADGDKQPARVKILDFGVAKLRAPTAPAGLTQTGAVLGTPGYMAPEQASGKSRDVDARADLYAMGVVLYKMLGGRKPFEVSQSDDLVELLVEQRTAEPPPLDVPPALEATVRRALAVEPGDRFESAAAMRDALLAASDGPVPAIPMPVPEDVPAPQVEQTVETGPSHGEAADSQPTSAESPSAKAEEARDAAPSAPARHPWVLIAAGAVPATIAAIAVALVMRGGSAGETPSPPDAPPLAAALDAADAAPTVERSAQPTVTAPDAAPAEHDPQSAPEPEPKRPRRPVRTAHKTPHAVPPPTATPTPATATPTTTTPSPAGSGPALQLGKRRTFRGRLTSGALSQSFPFRSPPGSVVKVYVKSTTVEKINAVVTDDRWRSGPAKRLPPSQWDGCADCEGFLETTIRFGTCAVHVSAAMPGSFVVTVERIK